MPKTDGKFRFIHNLSWPLEDLVNWFISKDDASVKYETLDTFISLVQYWGVGCLMAKTDILSAFRILPLAPSDYHLVGLTWRGKCFINCTLCMGLSTSCAIFEAFSTSLHWIIIQSFPKQVLSHLLDDFLFVSDPQSGICLKAMNYFLEMCKTVNIPIKHSKTVLPCTKILAHGLEVDSVDMLVRLPLDKLNKCKQAISSVMGASSVTLVALQQLHGLLNFACRAIAPGRAFLRRICDAMQGLLQPHHHIKVSNGMRED